MDYGREIHRKALDGMFGEIREAIKYRVEEEAKEKLKKMIDEQRAELEKKTLEIVAKAIKNQHPKEIDIDETKTKEIF